MIKMILAFGFLRKSLMAHPLSSLKKYYVVLREKKY